jgi:23S rRNA (guanosine2251-2'-O)-methyltransferase
MPEKKAKDQLVAGIRPVLEAIKAGKEINKVFLKNGSRSGLFDEVFQLIRTNQVPFQFVPIEKLNRMSSANHQGIVAQLSIIEYKSLEEIIQRSYEEGIDPFIVVLDQITDVRNFGAIARTVECAGAHAILIPAKGSVTISVDAIKTSAGALNRLAVCRSDNLEASIKYMRESGICIIASTEKASDSYYNSDLKGPVALIMGSEESGIEQRLLKLADRLVKIPMSGKVDSLNVSVACGILAFEIVRQRTFTV